MRWPRRFVLGASIILLIPILLLVRKLDEIWDQYNVPAYIQASFGHSFQDQPHPISGQIGDKIVIMAKLEDEDTGWVNEYLPTYIFPFSLLHEQ